MELFVLLGEGKLQELWASKTCENNRLAFRPTSLPYTFQKGGNIYCGLFYEALSISEHISTYNY